MQKIEGQGLDRWIRKFRGEFSKRQNPHSQEIDSHSLLTSTVPVVDHLADTVTPDRKSSDHLEKKSQKDQGFGELSTSRDRSSSRDRTPPQPDSSLYGRWVAQVGVQAAFALDYAHKRHVIHRDIKPSNLILDEAGTIWVADFGLALRLDDPNLSRGDGVLGTPRYTSPEQAARKVVDLRTDIYSLGATLYELLTLRPPFDGETSDEVIRKILTESAPLPRTLVSHISRDLETIILKALSRRAEDRYASAEEMAEDLNRFLHYEPVRARRIGPVGRMWRLSQRHPAVSTVTFVALALIIGITSFAYRQVASERDDAILARSRTMQALEREKEALEQAKSAMRNQLWREASLVRLSSVPDRRSNILGLVRDALSYDPEPELKTKLRDEVVQALCLSDVRQENPLVNDRIAGFEVIDGGQRAVSVSENGRTLTLWDIPSQSKTAEVLLESLFDQSLFGPSINQGINLGSGRTFEGVSGGLLSRRSGRVLVPVGSQLGVLRPDGRTILWIDSQSAELRGSWESPDHSVILAVVPVGNQDRILTIEYTPKNDVSKPEDRRQSFGLFSQSDELKIVVHDLANPKVQPLVLDKFQPSPERGRFVWPLLSVSPDGTWVAISRMFDEQIRIVDLSDAKELGNLSAQVPVSSIAAGPDRLLAVAGGGTIRLWQNEPSRNESQSAWSTVALPSFGTHLGSIRQLRFSPDRNLIAASGRSSGIELWDIKSGEPVATLPTAGQIDHMAFASASGKFLASMDDPRNGGLRVWSLIEPVAKQYLLTAPENVLSLSIQESDAGSAVFAHTFDGRIWFESDDCQTMKKLSLDSDTDRFGTVQIDPNQNLWVFSGVDAMQWQNWNSRMTSLPPPAKVFSLPDFSGLGWSFRGFGLTRMPAGLIFANNSDRVVLTRGSMICLLDPAISSDFLPVLPSDFLDQARHQETERNRRSEPDRNQSREGNEQSGRLDREGSRKSGEGPSEADRSRRGFPFSPGLPGFGGGRSGGSMLTRRVSLAADGQSLVFLRGESCEYWTIGERRLTSIGQIWESRPRTLPTGVPKAGITALALSADGNWLALGTKEGKLILISVAKWRVVGEYSLQNGETAEPQPITDLNFSTADNSLLAVASHRQVSVWSISPSPSLYLTLPLENNSNTPCQWDRSGQNLFFVDDQKHIIKFQIKKILQNIQQIGLAN
ncbi:MAG: Serine/threonine-protein kinase PknB [Planctomycetota bacterium]|jgi:serine/threonine protein kinase